ncbi:MAG: hypothetical protein JRN21_09815 [Nitrososphaerota archaeon]|nr:hypothetical protein [Nitrososphaerota archaeon]
MGWNYKYILMPSNFDVEKFSKAALDAGYEDMTNQAVASAKWEEDRINFMITAEEDRRTHAYTKAELKSKSDVFWAFMNKEPDDPLLKRYRKAEKDQSLALYQIWFNKIAGRYIMFYTSFGHDTNNDFLTAAISQLYALGVVGTIWVIDGNSISDEIMCAEYELSGNSVPEITPLGSVESGIGNYQEFLKSYKDTGADLEAIHAALLDISPGNRPPVTMFGKYLTGTDDIDRFRQLITVEKPEDDSN